MYTPHLIHSPSFDSTVGRAGVERVSAQLEAQTLHQQLSPIHTSSAYLDRISVTPQAWRDFTICAQIPDPDLLVHATRGEQLVVATDCQRENVTLGPPIRIICDTATGKNYLVPCLAFLISCKLVKCLASLQIPCTIQK